MEIWRPQRRLRVAHRGVCIDTELRNGTSHMTTCVLVWSGGGGSSGQMWNFRKLVAKPMEGKMMSTMCPTRVRVYSHDVIILRVVWLCLSVSHRRLYEGRLSL